MTDVKDINGVELKIGDWVYSNIFNHPVMSRISVVIYSPISEKYMLGLEDDT